MKTLTGLALGTLLSLGTVASASAAAPQPVPSAPLADSSIEVIVVTAKRPSAQTIEAARLADDVVASARRAARAKVDRAPPAMPIEIPKLDVALSAPPQVRF